ncbi:MAG: succinate dehydrogenase cytochrome b subunit [Nitrospirae bacterium]|nr:succinate dehydrogenase cytochrome b subunit [Nitrospirota bacterium]
MRFLSNPTGRKIVMSLTGLMMIFFAVIHLLGNISFYKGPQGINAYANVLQGLGPLLWTSRFAMLTAIFLHGFFGIRLTLENRRAKSPKYAVNNNLSTTFAGRSMIWTGLLIAFYLGYHLLHFTLQIIFPETSAARNPDALGRPDVYLMMIQSFHKPAIVFIYFSGLAALSLHLSHGIQSMVQTVGLNSEKTVPLMMKVAAVVAAIVFLAYISIPAGIIANAVGK